MTPKRFELANPTAPTAGGGLPASAEERLAHSLGMPAPRKPLRTGFTWRQTAEERDALDALVKAVSRRLGRSVDKATVLAELVAVANRSDPLIDYMVAALEQ